jgi:hypothetical protein
MINANSSRSSLGRMAIHLLVNGIRVAPESPDPDRPMFRLILPVHEIRLVSGHASPEQISGADDRRQLGVAVRGIRWVLGQTVIETPIGSPAFIDGFHGVEYDDADARPFRWTNGDAALPPGYFPPRTGEVSLQFELVRWEGTTVQTPAKPAAAVLGAFENLGENCELALAQRYYGVELPLTLLRWAGTSFGRLLNGLENCFDGLGDPRTTEVTWQTIDYRLRTPYLNFHTAASERRDAIGVSDILHTGCATLRLLRRKLLRDIAGARRIFVFSSADPAFGQPEMHRLHAALRDIGPARLLCVTLRQPGQPSTRVERLADGLYAGYLDRFVIPEGPFDEWLALCSRVVALQYAG